jgi:hypothetical protein
MDVEISALGVFNGNIPWIRLGRTTKGPVRQSLFWLIFQHGTFGIQVKDATE